MANVLNTQTAYRLDRYKEILAYLIGRPVEGATTRQLCALLGLKQSSIGEYTTYLLGENLIYLAEPPRRKFNGKGFTEAVYKHGQPYMPRIKPDYVYRDLPPEFFGSVRRQLQKA